MSYNSTTPHLQLPQWILSDPPQMADFNIAFGRIDDIADYIYPVGSIYLSTNNVNPGTIFGGTWEAWGGGRVPVGVVATDTDFNTANKTGGEKTRRPSQRGVD